jgi:S1-C subfamily serine protease
VNRVVPQLIASGKYAPPSLGIEADDSLNRALMRELGLTGVAVLRVLPGSSAEAAGLQPVRLLPGTNRIVPGDVILSLDDVAVESVARLASLLDDRQVGDPVRLNIWREGKTLDITVSLQSPTEPSML